MKYGDISDERGQGPNVLLYLPPAPIFQSHDGAYSEFPISQNTTAKLSEATDDPLSLVGSMQQALATMASAIVVTINYRLGKAGDSIPATESSEDDEKLIENEPLVSTQPEFYQFPVPVHDTLAGFDWIQTNLKPTKLGVFGSQIGGSLALMLALTEARSVHAVAAVSPVCDWPGLDDYCTTEEALEEKTSSTRRKRNPKTKGPSPSDLVPLLQAREELFASPERSFDSFASPILLLRSAGRDVPKTFPQYHTGPGYPVPVLKNPNDTAVVDSSSSLDADPDLDSDDDRTQVDGLGESPPPVRRRRALSRWPPYGLDYGNSGGIWSGPGHGVRRLQVTLPWVRVMLNESGHGDAPLPGHASEAGLKSEESNKPSVISQQSEEMVSVMRRACFWGQEKGVGEKRVTLFQVDTQPADEAGAWFRDIWDQPRTGD